MPPKTEIKYPKFSVVVCAGSEKTGVSEDEAEKLRKYLGRTELGALIGYAPPLTAVDVATLMGFETEEKDGEKFGDDFLFKDYYGKKVRAHNNVRNRPLFMPQSLAIQEEILNRRYDLNGEPFIVADDAVVLNGQHQGVALYIAQQRRDSEKRDDDTLVWAKHWPGGIVSIDKVVVYGVKNLDRVVNTIDTCRSRTFQNVLYRSPYFTKIPTKSSDGYDRKAASSLCTAAVRVVWGRTAMSAAHLSTSTKRTNTARAEWVENHGGGRGRFVGCVKEVLEKNRKTESGRKFTDLGIDAGYAAGLMYLMMCSDTPVNKVDTYLGEPTRTAKPLSFAEETVETAIDFWTLLGRRNDDGEPTGKLAALTRALDRINAEEEKLYEDKGQYKNLRGNLNPERDHTVCVAWTLFAKGKRVTDESLVIKYTDPDPKTGKRSFEIVPTVGGIDLGNSSGVPSPINGEKTPTEVEVAIENGRHVKENEVGDEFSLVGDLADETTNTTVPNGVHESVADAVKGPNGTPPPPMQLVLDRLHKENPDLGPILCKTKRGQYVVWGDNECHIVERLTGRKAMLRPSRMVGIDVGADEFEGFTDQLTKGPDATVVGVAVEDPEKGWMIQTVVRPAKKKGAKK